MGNGGAKNTGVVVEDGRKFVCILYSSQNKTHRKNTKAFRDALRADAAGNLKTSHVDVSHETFCAEDYLKNKPQNLILLSVDEEGAELLQNVISKPWVQEYGMPRVLSISFGTTKPQDMIPILKNRPPMDQKDFCFDFCDVSNLDANDFSDSPVMAQLITSLIASNQ